MVVATQVIFSLVIALTLSIIFGVFLQKEVPRTGFLFFFLIIFLFTLVGGLWFQPFGPAYWGIFWVPMVIVGLAGAVFLYYRAPRPPRPQSRRETIEMLREMEQRKKMEKMTYLSMDMLFWFVLILLISAIALYFLKEFFF
jgi:hypothetical protein